MQWYTERCFLCSICVDGFLRCCIWLPLICYDLTDFLQLCVFWCFFPIFFCFLPLFMWLPSIAPISRIPCNFATFHGSRIRSTFFLSHNLAFGRLYCFFFFSCFEHVFNWHFIVFLYQSYEFLANDNLAPRGVHCCSRKCEQELKQKFTQLSCTLNNINTNCSFSASQYSATNDIVICWNQGTLPHQAVIRLCLDS